MEDVLFVLKIIVSVALGIAALWCLLKGFYLWFKLYLAKGESYGNISLKVAGFNFLAGAAVSLIVFLWNPVFLLLLAFLGMSLLVALAVHQSVASPYILASGWQRLLDRQKSRHTQDD